MSVSPPGRRAVQYAAVTVGRLTSGARMLPGFLIVGAQRCGTTSMYRTLERHPAVMTAVMHKGVHYFDMNYGRGIGWYAAHFPLSRAARWLAASVDIAPVTFESSPYYMFHPLAAARIARDLPSVKLVVLVRDPVERAYSAHAHELARGFETESFSQALELENDRVKGEVERITSDSSYLSLSHQHHAYRARGQYIDQLERLEKEFGAERIHVVDSGDFFADPAPEYDALLDFLGLPHRGYPAFERHNARPRSRMPDAIRQELDEYFLPYDERLTAWLGRPPSWRR